MNIEELLTEQGPIAPGTQGWWKVWGAGVGNVRVGDLIVFLHDGEMITEGPVRLLKRNSLRCSFLRPDGTWFSLGRGYGPIVLYRQGTKHTLA